VAGSLRPSGFSTPVQPADVLRFVPTSLGDQTAGTWSRYFRGADVGLSGPSEDIDAIDVTLTDAGATTLLLSTRGNFSVPGLSGSKEDVFAFTFRGQPRLPTVGTFSRALVLDGSRFGLSGLNLDAFSRVPPLAPSAQLDAALQTGTSDPESLSKSDLALGALDYAMHLQERKDPPSE
jgi:hypothetical protein